MPCPSLEDGGEGGQDMSFLVLERMTRTAAGLGHPDTHPFHMPLKQADGGGTCTLVPKQTPWQAPGSDEQRLCSQTPRPHLCAFSPTLLASLDAHFPCTWLYIPPAYRPTPRRVK